MWLMMRRLFVGGGAPGASPVHVVLHGSSILPPGGVFDTPTEFPVSGNLYITLFFQYIESPAGSGGGFTFKIECSPFAADQTVFEDWFQTAIYESGDVESGLDTTSRVQREEIEYTSVGATVETFTYGPINIGGNIERMRVSVCESGDVANPGNLGLIAMLYPLG